MTFLKLKHNPFKGADELWAEAVSDLDDAIPETASRTAGVVKGLVQDKARRVGWGDTLVEKIDVHRTGSQVFIGIHPDDASSQEAFGQEYGSHRRPPRPVLRPTIRRYRREINELYRDYLGERLFDRGSL